MSRYKKIKSCDPFYKGPRKDSKPTSSKPVAKEEKLEEQGMPRAAKDLMKRQLIMKKTATKKKAEKKQKKTAQSGTKKFQRIPGESKKEYFMRIDQEATQEVAEALKASRKMRDGRKKHLRDRKKKITEKKRLSEENASFDLTKDDVRFGDVVMQPPSITAKPRKAAEANKGSKALLLHSLLPQKTKETNMQNRTPDNSGITKTKKRKHMSALEQEKADKDRKRAIMAYRMIRKQRRQEQDGIA